MNYSFSLIVCTYNRSDSLRRLLKAIQNQTMFPNEVLIIDGSESGDTEKMLEMNQYRKLKYYRVDEKNRGLTLQRNYGIGKVADKIDFVCFLDDDIVPNNDYFEKLLNTYKSQPDAIATGGWIRDETVWERVEPNYSAKFDEYVIDRFVRKLGQRNVLRKRLGLISPLPPGFMPVFSHGFSTGFLPPSGKTYEVEFFMGGVSSYKKSIFQEIEFSRRFAGYGLYEDMDFCLRASNLGKLYVNTAAKVAHLHEESGRPDYFKYGRMVIENGYYVWRLKYPAPRLKARLKWHGTAFLLTLVRLGNVISTSKSKEALTESFGRISGWWSLILKRDRTSE